MSKMIKIPAKKQVIAAMPLDEIPRKKVAAYCRVSSNKDEQELSYEAQVQHYTNYIKSHSEWILAGIYADDGITGLNMKSRTEFNRMINDALIGRIDIIITKSISRFARNTVDCLTCVRKLKEKGIEIIFEKENIRSLESSGEVMLTILASLAQQESQSISQNVQLGLQYRFQQGKVMVNSKYFLGYDKDENGKLVINKEQAEIVKRIYREYLDGASCDGIAARLTKDGIPTLKSSKKWYGTTIYKILNNEKYIGDALLQKTVTVDFLNKKRVVNNGILPQYYVEEDHEAIIPREIQQKVQEEMARRSAITTAGKNYSANNCFSQRIYCSCCGEEYRKIHWNNRGKRSVVWRCYGRLNKSGCNARTVYDNDLKNSFINAVNEIIKGKNYFGKIENNIKKGITSLQNELIENLDGDYYDISNEILRKKAEKERLLKIKEVVREHKFMTEFNETLARHIIDKIIVYPDYLAFKFVDGVVIEIKDNNSK